jgi:hypothetical protein
MRWVYRALYVPSGRPSLVFKEVGLNDLLLPLVTRARLRAAILVRHPCAVVSSVLRGQAAGLMPTGRRAVAQDLLRRHDPELAARWESGLPAASPAAIEALLWRIEVESSLRATANETHVIRIVYEDLCRRPAELAREIFAHFGLPHHGETARLLREMASRDRSVRRRRGERGADDYFSVFRDSLASADRWKTELSSADARDVLNAVSDSEAFAACATIGSWAA